MDAKNEERKEKVMKPILFNTDMIIAIMEGKKTVTRRAVKFPRGWNPKFAGYIPDGAVLYGSNNIPAAKAPYQPGDILWVRETWSISDGIYLYRAFPGERSEPEKQDAAMRRMGLKWHSSRCMPREAARIFLRVINVQVERLQDINGLHAKEEGCEGYVHINPLYGCPETVHNFKAVWDSTIKPKDRPTYGWEANPWVWVIEFKRISKEEAENGK